MKHEIFDISFEKGGRKYSGWVNPSDKTDGGGRHTIFHVVLDGVSFGYLSFKDCKWTINEDRPASLIEAVSREIEKHYQF